MKFKIDPSVFETFPGLNVGILRANGVDNHGECPDLVEEIKSIQEEIRDNFDLGTLADCPKIQNWRKAYALFGAKPKKHLSSVESLYRMTLEGRNMRPINKLVDIYNCISMMHMVPVGGDDLSRVEGDILLRFANGDEPFSPLGSDEPQTARKGEVIYADNKEVLCRRWNWRESNKTKMTEDTHEVLLVAEGLPPVTAEEIEHAVSDLSRMIQQYCGGKTRSYVLGFADCGKDL
jgi:lysyl-tRNA synthetase class 2